MKIHSVPLLLSGLVLLSVASGQTTRPAAAKPTPVPPKAAPMQTGILLVRSDKAASLSIDGKGAGELTAGGFLSMSEVAGEHFVEAREKDGTCKWEKKVSIPVGMQVAEVVDFAAACPERPEAVSSLSAPLAAAAPEVVDPKVQEAHKQFERGCTMLALARYQDAIPPLEEAIKYGPLPSLEGCDLHGRTLDLDGVRSAAENAKAALRDCPSSSSMKGSNLSPDQIRDACGEALGYEAGEYQAAINGINNRLKDEDRLLNLYSPGQQADEMRSINDQMNRIVYLYRGLSWFAQGNTVAALPDLQTSIDLYKKYPAEDESLAYFYRAVMYSDIGNLHDAVDDCRVVLTFKNFAPAAYARRYCTKLIADNQSTVTVNAVASPAGVASPALVDSKIQEANNLHERGCLLNDFYRYGEAVPILEKAAALNPDLDPTCLVQVKSRLKDVRDSFAECESSGVNPKAKNPSPNRSFCTNSTSKIITLYSLGRYEDGLKLANSVILEGESGQFPKGQAAHPYLWRALVDYALDNPVAALRDVKTALAWCQQETCPDKRFYYFFRAFLLAGSGDREAASADCRIALTLRLPPGYQTDFCTRLVPSLSNSDRDQPESSSNVAVNAPPADDPIARISKGRYSPMPPMQVIGGNGSGSPKLTIENGTQYGILLHLSGPLTNSFSIPPGGSTVLDLPAGAFKVAAEIPNSSIIPFYGEQTFNNGTTYVEKFYIQRAP